MKGAAQPIVRTAALILFTGVGVSVLVRYSPGALVDERELNQRLGEDTLASLRAEKQRNSSIVHNFVSYFRGLAHGDLGYSESNDAPIMQLIADRTPTTFKEVGIGLIGAWLLGMCFAIPVARFPRAWLYDTAVSGVAALALSLPVAVLAYLCLSAGASSSLVLGIALTPRIFRFARNVLLQAYGTQHVAMARARGVPERNVLWSHVMRGVSPQLLALGSSSLSMAIGAIIPIEAICGSPGLGRLAWQAATARDLPLLMNLTMLIALATSLAAILSERVTTRPSALHLGE